MGQSDDHSGYHPVTPIPVIPEPPILQNLFPNQYFRFNYANSFNIRVKPRKISRITKVHVSPWRTW